MCSIPGLPTPGSQIPVLIVRVSLNPHHGLVELWVNMDDGSKHTYAQMKDEIQIPQQRFNGLEGKPGDLCLVCISDTWHRARIVSIQIETYNVYLIDQGQPHIATSEALAWGQSESFLLPPEMESCILANIFSPKNEWPEQATKFLMSLPGKTFKGLVQHVLMPDRIFLLDIPTISNQICRLKAAKKMDKTKFKMLVQKCLQGVEGGASPGTSFLTQEHYVGCKPAKHDQFLYPELLTNTFETVIVTEVTGPQNIFCKLLIFSKAVKLLSEQIHQHYEEGSDLGEASHLGCGDPCAARGLDGRWHRSLLKENTVTSDGTVEVFNVDEGKAELVNVGDVRPLLGKFLRMPVVTYRCSMSGVKANRDWSAEETDYLKTLLLHQTVIAKFDHINAPQDAYHVTLYADDSACYNKIFLERAGLLESSKSDWELRVQSEKSPSPISVGENRLMDVHKINLTNELPEEVAKSKVVNGRISNESTSSMHDIDAKVNCEVHDFPLCNGHLSTVSSCESLSACEDVFAVGKSVNVKVSCIENPQRFWCQTIESGNSLKCFMEDLQNHYASARPQPLTASICVAHNPDNNIWYRAKIIANQDSPNVDVRFIDYGQTQKIPLQNLCPIDPAFLQLNAQAFQCSLFSLNNPSNLTPAGCVDAASAEFQKFVDLVHSSGSGLKCIITAKSEEDGLVLDVEDLKSAHKSTFDGSLNVNPVLGEQVSKMKPQEMPGLIQQLSNGSEKVALTNEETSIQELVKRPTEQNVCSNNGMCATPDASPPAMILNGDSRETMNVKTEAKASMREFHSDLEMSRHSACYSPKKFGSTLYAWPDGSSNTLEVYASCIVGPHYFWCQYSNTENLDTVSKLAQEAGQEQELISSQVLKPGSPCLALFSDDEQWYRAQVTQKTDNIINVFFVDYGNDSEVNIINVRPLPTKLLEVPPQAFLCCLNGSDASNGTFDDEVYDYFYNLLVDKLLKLTVIDVQKHSEIEAPQYSVEMTCEGENVNTSLQKYWKPVTGENVMTTSLEMDALLQSDQTASNTKHVCVPKEASGYVLKQPVLSRSRTEMVYASSIPEPHFFWCQFANTQELQKLSQLTQKAGQAQQEHGFLETLGPGSPCLALFSDNQWYRALVITKADGNLHVLFSDYGNESEVDVLNVKPLPQSLLEIPAQAFLCRLHGFDQSKGSWDEKAYDDFYYLLVDKLFCLTVFDVDEHPDIAVPWYAVEMECEGVVVNRTMEKYWKADGYRD